MTTPLLVSTEDAAGGAAIAAYRLLSGLRTICPDTRMFVGFKTSDDDDVIGPSTAFRRGTMQLISSLEHQIRLRICPDTRVPYSPAALPYSGFPARAATRFDIVNLHWVNRAFLRPEDIARFKVPVVWTLHDMWPLTGGCHYDCGCGRFVDTCGTCPILDSKREKDASRRLWKRKLAAWQRVNLTIVSPSRWLAEEARRSSLMRGRRIEVIPNGLDLALFRPRNKEMARSVLGLPNNRRLIVFGAEHAKSVPRKGYELLRAALESLGACDYAAKISVAVIGASGHTEMGPGGVEIHHIGRLRDEISMIAYLSAADLAVLPSRQENLANFLAEALACGTPCVAFNIGGNPDLIVPGQSGYLAKPFDSTDFAAAIVKSLEDDAHLERLGKGAREVAENILCLEKNAAQYMDLFNALAKK